MTQDLAGTVQDLTVNAISYNPASQLASLTRSNDSFAYTGHYNINRAYGTNGLNQLTSAGASALTYDGRGNLTANGNTGYSYTSENRLATVLDGTHVAYFATGNLLEIWQPTGATRFDHLGARMIAEYDGNDVLKRRYVHGPGTDEPLLWYEGSSLNDKRWLHSDERGSVIAVSNSVGSGIGINRYDEYGIPLSTNMGRFQYTGQAWLGEIGLYYYKARMYSPYLGRFMQTDPIGYGDGINWYNYVDGDPINRVDPDGQEGFIIIGTGIAHAARMADDPIGTLATDAAILISAVSIAIDVFNTPISPGPDVGPAGVSVGVKIGVAGGKFSKAAKAEI